MDDITIVSSPNLIDNIKTALKNEFKMTDQGEISFVLGITITREHSKWQIYLQQSHYIKALLEWFNMTKSNPVSTPLEPSTWLIKPSSDNEIDSNIPYRQAVGMLMYLMLATRPDISASLNKVAQFSTNYDSTHWTAIKRIFRYLQERPALRSPSASRNSAGETNFLKSNSQAPAMRIGVVT